jgi:hypothetical protein
VASGQRLCLCGHLENVHSTAVTTTQSLPPKGGCPESGCTTFRPVRNTAYTQESCQLTLGLKISLPVAPRTICECGQSYLAHSRYIPFDTSLTLIPDHCLSPGAVGQAGPSQNPPVPAWGPPSAPNPAETSNTRRFESMVHNRRITPLVPSRRINPARGRPSSGHRASRSSNTNSTRESYVLDCAILGYPVSCYCSCNFHVDLWYVSQVGRRFGDR